MRMRKNVVIRPADKGRGLVIMTKQYYKIEMERQLGDSETYHKLIGNPLLEYKSSLEWVINKGRKGDILSIKGAKYLNPIAYHTPFIYFLPKVHKSITDPPRRPIINGIKAVCLRLGQYIDTFLQLLVVKTKAYIRNTKHVIQCPGSLAELDKCILATADEGCLYTIIGHQEAIASMEWAIKDSDLSRKHKTYILRGACPAGGEDVWAPAASRSEQHRATAGRGHLRLYIHSPKCLTHAGVMTKRQKANRQPQRLTDFYLVAPQRGRQNGAGPSSIGAARSSCRETHHHPAREAGRMFSPMYSHQSQLREI